MTSRLVLSRPARAVRALLAALVLVLTAGGTVSVASAAPLPSRAVLDGPGRLYAIRTFDSGEAATASQKAACKAGLGPIWSLTEISALSARYYSPTVDPQTGLVTKPDARTVGPIFGCVGATVSTTQPGTSWGEVPLSLGTIHARGQCSLRFSSIQAFATESGCILGVTPENGLNGVVTSASYTDLLGLGGTTTGSVWTAFVSGAAGRSQTVTPPSTPAPVTPKAGNLRHLILRAVGQHAVAVPPSCPAGTRTATTADLHAQQPDPATDELIAAPSAAAAGTVTLCFEGAYSAAVQTTAVITLPAGPANPSGIFTAGGLCYHRDIGATSTVGEACDLAPTARTGVLQEGMITSNGLVTTGTNGAAQNAAVWVIGGFGTLGDRAS
ncbi:MAG: hypothetical protein AAGC46_18890 [Solirubrobacteraceae bacterium]